MAVKAFQLLGDGEGALHHRLVLGLGLQFRLVVDGLGEADRIGGVLRHQLAQLVDLAVGHLQHAADIAQHAARLQRAEGDDLRHLIAAVALLHVCDHLVAAVLAEVDVEVRHRHALGIEEALEQQTEADGIEVGDGERIGDQGACAGTAAGPDRNVLRLRPLDEVGHDEEVAGVFHALDDAELELKTFAVLRFGAAVGEPLRRQPVREPFFGALAQFGALVDLGAAGTDGETRQDRLVGLGAEGAALGNLHGGGHRLRQIGKQLNHFAAGLEAMLRGELAPVGLRNDAAFGDADQRVVGLVVLGGGEIRLIGRDQRDALRVGEIDQQRLGLPFGRHAVALQFDVEPVAKQFEQRLKPRGGEMALPGGDGGIERAARPAGERDHALGLAFEPVELEPRRLVRRRVEEGAGIQPHEAAVAGLAGGEQDDAGALGRLVAGAVVDVAEIERQRAADDGLDAIAG